MKEPILLLVALFGIVAAFLLWLRITKLELRQKMDAVNSAQSQLNACRMFLSDLKDGPDAERVQAVDRQCRDIYRQAAVMYNETLQRPANRIPGWILGYRPVETDL